MNDNDEVIIKGAVLVPDTPDHDGDVLSAAEIQEAAYQFLPGYSIVDVQHSFKKQAEVVESYITPEETTFNNMTYPAGTWFLSSRVTDPTIVKAIQSGELKGYSVSALPEQEYDELRRDLPVTKTAASITTIEKRKTFADVDKWFAFTVSIVDIPAVPLAIFKVFNPTDFIKKHKGDNVSENKELLGLFERLLDRVIPKEAEQKEEKKEDPKEEASLEKAMSLISALTKRVEALEGKDKPKEEAKDEAVKKSIGEDTPPDGPIIESQATEEVESVEEEEPEPEEEELEEEIISKSLPVDKSVEPQTKSLNERLGRDALGRRI